MTLAHLRRHRSPPPPVPAGADETLRAELARLAAAYAAYQAQLTDGTPSLRWEETGLRTGEETPAFWAQTVAEAEAAGELLQTRLTVQPNEPADAQASKMAGYVAAANAAADKVQLDDAETRRLIDAQSRQAGWEADSTTLRYALGARRQKGRNLAIAEWPTMTGPADYVLFAGLTVAGVVEAKRKHIDVAAALPQAKRYSRSFNVFGGAEAPGGPWDKHRIPFVFAANGRPYLRQLETLSGIWFCDLRRPTNLSRALDGWYTPAGLLALLKQDAAEAHARLVQTPLRYDFALRPYQQAAILAVEAALAAGQRSILVAMATGTGKTKLRRILFLVDRAALGEQAANAFKDTRIENLQTFADIFGIKELADQTPDTETTVHIATVQGMVQRVLYPDEDEAPPPIDQYDCIVVDECHRGYLLDRELSELELSFRNQEDYISKYRRVVEYFVAVKIGPTATPALHTVEIFGKPVYTYSYRAAVIDGYLVDHGPPI